MVPEPNQTQRTYFMEPENTTEMAHIIFQDRNFTRILGGLFPEGATLTDGQRIIDIGCGTGGWLLDVAHQYQHVEAIGIDISKMMVEYANVAARSQGLDNVLFQEMNALERLDFPDNHFDVVSARSIFGWTPKPLWPKLLQEVYRITKPGGYVRLTEGEWPITNAPTVETFSGMFTRALKVAGTSFSPDGRHIGITPMLEYLLHKAGYENFVKKSHYLDSSYGTPDYEFGYQNFMISHQLLQPFLIRTGQTTEEEVGKLYQQALSEMLSEDYCCLMYLLTVRGQKPLV